MAININGIRAMYSNALSGHKKNAARIRVAEVRKMKCLVPSVSPIIMKDNMIHINQAAFTINDEEIWINFMSLALVNEIKKSGSL